MISDLEFRISELCCAAQGRILLIEFNLSFELIPTPSVGIIPFFNTSAPPPVSVGVDLAKKSSGKKMVDRYSHTTGDFFALHFFAIFSN
jgi:hypothetical protein